MNSPRRNDEARGGGPNREAHERNSVPTIPDEPEHRNDRRRFLIYALMLGAIPPERVVERVVADLEHEAMP